MAKALISIDYSNDFVADNGKLTVGKRGQAIAERIAQVTREAYEAGDYIFFMMDCHEEGDVFHPETQLFPPHNIVGTEGRHLYGELESVYEAIKDSPRVFWMDKRRYSAFAGTDLDMRLRERQVDTVVLTGVLSDICVMHTAIDAYNKGYHIEVVASAIATTSDAVQEHSISHFKNVLGARIIE